MHDLFFFFLLITQLHRNLHKKLKQIHIVHTRNSWKTLQMQLSISQLFDCTLLFCFLCVVVTLYNFLYNISLSLGFPFVFPCLHLWLEKWLQSFLFINQHYSNDSKQKHVYTGTLVLHAFSKSS